MTEPTIKKGQEYELTIESLAYGGKGQIKRNVDCIKVTT